MSDLVFRITSIGLDKMRAELSHLKKVERKAVQERIAVAREFGDLSENAEYTAAKDEQSMLESKINYLEHNISRAEVIDPTKIKNKDIVTFGCFVHIIQSNNQDKILVYQLVSDYESDIEEGRLYINSPIANALLGKKVGDVCEAITPKGTRIYKIVNITHGET